MKKIWRLAFLAFVLLMVAAGIFTASVNLANAHAVAPVTTHMSRSDRLVGAETILPNHQKLFSNKVIQKPGDSAGNIHYSYPNTCLAMWGSASNVSKNVVISYHIDGYIKNTCTVSTVNGGEWGADFDVDCNGNWINDGSISGGLPAMNVGQQLLIVDGNYKSVCVDSAGDLYSPSEVVVYLSASAYLTQDKGIVTGSSSIDVE